MEGHAEGDPAQREGEGTFRERGDSEGGLVEFGGSLSQVAERGHGGDEHDAPTLLQEEVRAPAPLEEEDEEDAFGHGGFMDQVSERIGLDLKEGHNDEPIETHQGADGSSEAAPPGQSRPRFVVPNTGKEEGPLAKRRRAEKQWLENWCSETAASFRRPKERRGIGSVMQELKKWLVAKRGETSSHSNKGVPGGSTWSKEEASSSSSMQWVVRFVERRGLNDRAAASIKAAYRGPTLGMSSAELAEEASTWIQALGGWAAIGAKVGVEAKGSG